jgi:hypothetical protein
LPSQPDPDGRGPLVRYADLAAFVDANGMPPLPPEGSTDLLDELLTSLPADQRAQLEQFLRREYPGT